MHGVQATQTVFASAAHYRRRCCRYKEGMEEARRIAASLPDGGGDAVGEVSGADQELDSAAGDEVCIGHRHTPGHTPSARCARRARSLT